MISEERVFEEYRRRYQNPDVARQYASEVSSRDPRGPRQLRNLIARIVTGAEQAAIASMMARLPSGGTILDVPSGTGKELPVLTRRGRVVGADSSMAMLRLYAQMGGSEAMCADISTLPIKSHSVDVIVCNRFLHRLPPTSRGRVLGELHRVSKRWALTYFGIRSTGQGIVMAFERLFGIGGGGPTFLSSLSAIQTEVEGSGWTVLTRRAVMRGVSAGYVFVLEKADDDR